MLPEIVRWISIYSIISFLIILVPVALMETHLMIKDWQREAKGNNDLPD